MVTEAPRRDTKIDEAPEEFRRSQWVTKARCRGADPEALFVRGAEQRGVATSVCGSCAVAQQCLADALDNRIEFGVWGGLTERQRRALLRANPDVTSWARFLAEGGEIVAPGRGAAHCIAATERQRPA
ncbi:WhiB family transcriptional regulator [Corynebacterium tapiri]|nr:WhiB family transcriptional regulator [Corynebacterium tapiri]